ncbi:MAG TPA: serine protease [bacterium]|jgi:S1-C subfamily serine protease|nr:serine protease [bacterium]
MQRIFLASLALACLLRAPLLAKEDALQASVVKVFVVQKAPDYYQPWQMGYQVAGSGSGFVIQGHRILTNAHVVANQVNIQVMKAGDTHKATARLLFVADDADLAELTVDEPGFFDNTKPVAFGPMPHQRDHVAAYGFPAGGEEMSITEGVVSRIEVLPYSHAGGELLTVQTDASINPGSSGGPVFKDGKFVGVSFESYSGGGLQNTGYFIPVVLVNRFLKDISDGHYDGVPGMGIVWQKLENPALRASLGLHSPRGGILIIKVVPGSGADGVLKEGDVLLKMDGVPVAENGTIPFGDGERVDLVHLISLHQMSDTAKVSLWRDGAALDVTMTLKSIPDLVPGPSYGVRPSYFVYGGLVFQVLNDDYLRLFGANAPTLMRYYDERGLPSPDRKQIVFINVVLPHEVNAGYHELSQAIVTEVNGKAISTLKDVVEAVKTPVKTKRGRFLVIKIDDWTGDSENRGSEVVLDAAAVAKAQPEILNAFGIPSAMSKDLVDLSGTAKGD